MTTVIVYLILINNIWEFVAIDNQPHSHYYCELTKKDVERVFTDWKVICVEDKGEDL